MRRINWVGVRNFAIIAGIAGLVLVWEQGFGAIAISAQMIITVLLSPPCWSSATTTSARTSSPGSC